MTVFKNGHFRDLLKWNSTTMFYDYWPPWTREFGSLLQIVPLLMIPFIGLVQSCRYLSSGSPDIFDVSYQYFKMFINILIYVKG